ncbi:MAG: large conductance mechanosensitive channel protein MscL [Chloroflexi bacterium CFX4]|nr:large conductance mechanosensitive channel protein MscL [Chloroflexi bacterium CFX4]MDL1922902.1 large conductance mechanosensitive channel protein MscL [Chloroflexi bacterium CFX3]
MIKEFITFVKRGNVIDLAVGIIMGAAFGAIVASLVNDIIMPPIGQILGGVDFSNIFIALDGKSYASLKAAQDAGAATINVGVFLNTIINFLIVAFAVFLLIRAVNRLSAKPAEKPAEEAPKPDPMLETQQKLIETLEKLNKTLEGRG